MDNLIQIFGNFFQAGNFSPVFIIIASFFAGIIASLSPCSLGVMPLIIGYVGGYSKSDNYKLFIQMLAFSFGLSSVLSIIGVVCAYTGKAFVAFASPVVLVLFSSIILILGLNLLGIIDLNFPAIVKKMPKNEKGGFFVFPFLVGVFFALASSPCSSPLLISIMALATVSKSILFSLLLLFAFAMGQCIIIIFAALFTSFVKKLSSFAKYSALLLKLCGILLVLVSFYIYYAIFSNIIK